MPQLLSTDAIRKQSLTVWNQFGEKVWIPNAKKNVSIPHKNATELEHMGIGKVAVVCTNGSSLENHIDTIKKYRNRFDVICNDKCFKVLLDHGIKADLVLIADANISIDFLGNAVEETKDVKLCCTPYANPEWTSVWKGPRYHYVNQDAIESEQIFKKIFGDDIRVIPAGSNVSNALITFMTDCGGTKNANWGAYERYYLIGYDYSWPIDGPYYAFNDPINKRHYMTHRVMIDLWGNIVLTSENLLFSAKWLISYITTFDLPVVNCSGRGILEIPRRSDLEREIKKVNPDKKAYESLKNSYKAWKQAFNNYKSAEKNFNSLKEVLLWQ